jgi:hypothetical protein
MSCIQISLLIKLNLALKLIDTHEIRIFLFSHKTLPTCIESHLMDKTSVVGIGFICFEAAFSYQVIATLFRCLLGTVFILK